MRSFLTLVESVSCDMTAACLERMLVLLLVTAPAPDVEDLSDKEYTSNYS